MIILPDGIDDYTSTLTTTFVPRIRSWVANGGVLIGYGRAMSWMADPQIGLLAVQQESLATPEAAISRPPAGPAGARAPGRILDREEDYLRAIRPVTDLPDNIPGALVRVTTDGDHWITAGVPSVVNALVYGRQIYTPIRLDKGINAAVFAAPSELLASGHLWEENRKQLAWKPFITVQREGRGTIIGFAADPNFRAHLDGLNLLFFNAVFRGPTHSRPISSRD